MALHNKYKNHEGSSEVWFGGLFWHYVIKENTFWGSWPAHTFANGYVDANTLPLHTSLSSVFMVLTLTKGVGNCPDWADQSILPP